MREEMQELLVNVLAGKMLTDADAPIPPPLVSQVKQVEAVLVAPPKMDREAGLRLLKDGSMLEAFGAEAARLARRRCRGHEQSP